MIQFPWRLVPRTQPSARMRVLAPVMAIVLTLLAGCILFASLGLSPLAAL